MKLRHILYSLLSGDFFVYFLSITVYFTLKSSIYGLLSLVTKNKLKDGAYINRKWELL